MFNFILIASAGILTMLNPGKLRSKLKIIGVIVGLIGAMAVVGYIINVPILYYYIEGINSAIALPHGRFVCVIGDWIYMSIRLKLTIMFLAIASIPLLFVSVLTFTNYKNSLEANRLSQLQDLAAFKADKIETYFAGLKAHIEIAQGFYNIKKNLPVLIQLADDPDNPEFLAAKKMLDAQLQQMQSVSDLSDIMLVNPQGKVVYAIRPGHYLKDLSNGS